MSYKNIIADIGNSRVKFKVDDTIVAFEYNTSDLTDYLQTIAIAGYDCFAYSSVNKEAESFILSKLYGTIENIRNVKELIDKCNSIDFSNVKGMGTDRMLSLIAVQGVTDSPLVTIDCGTAVTVNLLDEDNICLGGVIMPGFRLQSQALHNNTSNLPLVKGIGTKGYVGKDTEDSIRYGILNSIVGGIKTTIEHSSFSAAPDVFVTGGYGEAICERLNLYYPNVQFAENLVIKGIERLIDKAMYEKSVQCKSDVKTF